MKDADKPLKEYEGFVEGSEITLEYKDLGPQVYWRTVFIVEYFGPILITVILLGMQ